MTWRFLEDTHLLHTKSFQHKLDFAFVKAALARYPLLCIFKFNSRIQQIYTFLVGATYSGSYFTPITKSALHHVSLKLLRNNHTWKITELKVFQKIYICSIKLIRQNNTFGFNTNEMASFIIAARGNKAK